MKIKQKTTIILTVHFSFLLVTCSIAQSRIILNNDNYLVINNNAYLVLDNSNTNAITVSGAGGNIISEIEYYANVYSPERGIGAISVALNYLKPHNNKYCSNHKLIIKL